MKTNISKKELLGMDAIEVYKLVLREEIKCFPAGFWSSSEAYENARKCTIYLFEEVLGWSEADLLKNMSKKVLVQNKLKGMLTVLFNDVIFNAIDNAYPGKFKPWEFNFVPNKFWENEDNRREALLWLIDEKLMLSDEDIKSKWGMSLIKEHGLESLVKNRFGRSPYRALNFAKPGKFKPGDLQYTSKGYWDDVNNVGDYLYSLFKVEKKLSDLEICKLSIKDIYDNGLSTIIKKKGYTLDELKRLILARC